MGREVEFATLRGTPYVDGVVVQRRLVADMAADRGRPGVVLCVEHLPVITCGRSGDGSNLLVEPSRLLADGIEYHRSGRGGDVTYHGPGQWTVYPLLRLEWFGRDLHRYLRLLEESVIVFLRRYGVDGGRRAGLTGVWVGDRKVCAVGVAVTRWICWHGFALNIDLDVGVFSRCMHPCGIPSERGGVTSLSELLGWSVGMDEALPGLRSSMVEAMDLAVVGDGGGAIAGTARNGN